MWTRQHKRRKTTRLLLPALTAAFLGYFGYHAWNGDYGLAAKHRLEIQATELSDKLAELRAQRTALEERGRLLYDGSIERDMLDEQARRALGLARADEIVILFDKQLH